MEVVYRRCAGLDVHKDSVTATIQVFEEGEARQVRTKGSRTHWKEVQRLARWLRSSVVECVAMEPTGVYWKPVWNVLEKTIKLVLASPYQIQRTSLSEDRPAGRCLFLRAK
jgi:transposase